MSEFVHGNRNWFFVDRVSDIVTSTSVGEVWLYFYESSIIGVRDLVKGAPDKDRAGYFLDVENLTWEKNDGLTHYHAVTKEAVQDAINDVVGVDMSHVSLISLEELETLSIRMATNSFGRNIDRHLTNG